MKARPILFSSSMIRAMQAGQKTQTRRGVKLPTSRAEHLRGEWEASTVGGGGCRDKAGNPVPEQVCIWNNRVGTTLICPYGQPGDLLWVRETWAPYAEKENHRYSRDGFTYRADWNVWDDAEQRFHKWHPSLHMPRRASRTTLEIIAVRVEPLHKIDDHDALAEGVDRTNTSLRGYATSRFATLWDSINGPGAWATNPWVWVVEFKVHQRNVDELLAERGTV